MKVYAFCLVIFQIAFHCAVAVGVHEMLCSHIPSNPQISPILCPRKQEGSPKYTCPWFVTNDTNGGLTLESCKVLVEKQKWSTRFRQFNKQLIKSGAMFTMLGDSLAENMVHQLQCLEEFANIPKGHSRHFHMAGTGKYNPFLAPLPANYTMDYIGLSHQIFDHTSQDWFPTARIPAIKKMYIVLNIGAWLGRVRHTDDFEKKVNYVEVFKEHFAPHSPLIKMIRTLTREDNTTIIWRDINPAGICGAQTPWSYYDLFPEFNAIARRALAAEGALILDIWKDTLPYWDQHMGNNDQLHLCIYQMESAQNIWIKKLMDLIMRDLNGKRWSADSGH